MGQPEPEERPALVITSPANPRVKWLAGLQKRRHRSRERVTLVEGFAEVELAVGAGAVPTALYYCPDLIQAETRLRLVDRVGSLGAELVRLGRAAYERASYRESPDGFLAVVPDPARPLAELRLGDDALVLVCEAVEKPGNLGAMLRTAEAAGVAAVVAASPVADWANPNVVRASKGTLFAVPVSSAPTAEVVAWLRANDVRIVVATPEAAVLVTEVDLTGRCAVVVGAEHPGVSDSIRSSSDHLVRLPMAGRVNSLNVSTAAAITLYEAVRQRLGRKPR
jgi:TrmH family RNA methyltransferase